MNLPVNSQYIESELAVNVQVSRALANAPYGVLVVNSDFKIVYVNQQVEVNTGYSAKQIIGQNPRVFRSQKTSIKTFRDLYSSLQLNGHWSGYLYNRTKDGRIIKELSFIDKVISQGETFYLVIRANYLRLHQDLNKLKMASLRDSLTGLWNRNGLNKLQQIIVNSHYSMAFININQFKFYNDKYGHQFGDKLLQQVSKQLQSDFNEEYVFRLSGDEFMVVT